MYLIVIFRLIASPPLQSQKRTPASVQVVLPNNTMFLNVAFPTQQNWKNAKSLNVQMFSIACPSEQKCKKILTFNCFPQSVPVSSPSLDLPAQYPERPNVLMEKNAVVASVIPGTFAMKSACERLLILLQYEEFADAWLHF